MSQVLEPEPIEEQHGFFKQYVKIAGRKARCALCHGKILADAAYSINNGLICHDTCIEETKNLDNNVRRRTLKLMGIGAAFAGATAIGASRLASASGVQQTQITANGVILPSLTSDPANPEPGQMWYRSDAGVTAHFDAIENRVIYSNRIVKGSAVVTSKGIANGLSVLPNDGQDWGPDTMLGATAPGQYGPSYTQTLGIQEVFKYVSSNPEVVFTVANGDSFYGNALAVIYLLDGIFEVTAPATLPPYGGILLCGSGVKSTVIKDGTSTGLGAIIQEPSSGFGTGSFSGMQWNAFRDFMVLARTSNGSSSNITVSGINLQNPYASTNNKFERVYVVGDFSNYAIQLVGQGDSYIEKCRIENTGSGLAVNFEATTGPIFSIHELIASLATSSINVYNPEGQIFISNSAFDGITFGNIVNPYSDLPLYNLCIQKCQINGLPSVFKWNVLMGITNMTIEDSFIVLNPSTNIFNQVQVLSGSYPIQQWVLKNVMFLNYATPTNPVYLFTGNAITNWAILPYVHQMYLEGVVFHREDSNPPTYGIDTSSLPFIVNSTGDVTGYAVSVPTNPPVSGTVYQNTNPYDIEIDLPVYAATAGTAGYVTIAKGPTSTPTAIGNQYVNGATSSTSVDIIKLRVPAGWYYEFTASGVTFGTASVFAD